MSIIISRKIKKKEFGRGTKTEEYVQVAIKAFKKGIFTIIKGEGLSPGLRLIKIYTTTSDGHRRVVYLLNMNSGDAFLLFYRNKNDKLGRNISMQNEEFRYALHRQIDILREDIDRGEVDIYE